jgi:hypothetical protein
VAIADLNRDGKPDIVVANSDSNDISVLLAMGDGTFGAADHYGAHTAPRSVGIGDLNADGKLDLVAANFGSDDVSVLLGVGDGTFAPAVDYGANPGPASVAIGDLNADGLFDLVIANLGSDDVSVLLGVGDGAFAVPVNYGADSFPSGVRVADLDGDGDIDVVVTNLGSDNISILLNLGDGTLVSGITYKAHDAPVAIAVGDIDRNGQPDLIVANLTSNDIAVLLQDPTPPETSIDSQPASPTKKTSATFAFSSSEPATFKCRLDSETYSNCTSPKAYTGLAAGSHTFHVKATDAAGNSDATPARVTWTIDTTAPNTTITSHPATVTRLTSAAFSFTASEAGATFKCKIDADSYTSCTSPKTYIGLAGGTHTFSVKAKDAVGNSDATPARVTWTIDTTAPNTTITSHPATVTGSTSASFSFTASEAGSTFKCKLDSGSYTNCTSPKTYTDLAAGSHTFAVKAIDAIGNTDATPASFAWTIDLAAPDTISSYPAITNTPPRAK